jgi:spore coat polysaccharide biosynthesis protein SpsF
MRIAAVVQARMSSSRLPGKVLRPLAGKPLLSYVLERLERCEAVSGGVVVATSIDASDDPIADYCVHADVECHRGALDDVAGRFLSVGDAYGLDAVVRLSGDSPLLDQRLVDRGIALFQSDPCDLVTNVAPRTFPRGESVEVMALDALRRAHAAMPTAEDREHVTTLLYREPQRFRIRAFTAPEDWSAVRLVVDTEEDAERVEQVILRMTQPHWDYDCAALVELAREVET